MSDVERFVVLHVKAAYNHFIFTSWHEYYSVAAAKKRPQEENIYRPVHPGV